MRNHLFARAWLLLLLPFLLTTGCDSADDDTDQPEVINPEAFSMDTGVFDVVGKQASMGPNYTAALLRVLPVTILLEANLFIPQAVTAAALQADPIVEDGTWIWASTTTIDGRSATFRLTGTPDGREIDWSMRVTTTDPGTGEVYNDFELYTAETTLDGQEGTWQLYYRLDGVRTNVLNAEFDVGSASEKTLTFRVPDTAESNAGDSVRYGAEGNERSFFWTQVANALTHDIVWDAATKAGSITATDYKDGAKSCWDTQLNDVAC